MDFPCEAAAVEPVWLSRVLHEAGALASDATVETVSWEKIGTGQVGDTARFTLTYDHPGAGPATLAGKFAAADPTSRGTAAAFQLYRKEVGFYRELAPHLGVRVPRPFVAELAENDVDFVLLFEDLSPCRSGNQLDECSLADARAAIGQAAALHAPSRGHQMLSEPWLQPVDGMVTLLAEVYPQAQAVFRERYADALEPAMMAVCEGLAADIGLWFGRGTRDPCLIHGDFRLDNMLFAIRGGAEPLAVVDWQTVAIGNGLTDIGYFLGCGVGQDFRRAHEAELIDLYADEMARRGVRIEPAALRDDYRIGALHGVSTAVFSAANVVRTERGDANFLSMARGACSLALDHDSLGLLRRAA